MTDPTPVLPQLDTPRQRLAHADATRIQVVRLTTATGRSRYSWVVTTEATPTNDSGAITEQWFTMRTQGTERDAFEAAKTWAWCRPRLSHSVYLVEPGGSQPNVVGDYTVRHDGQRLAIGLSPTEEASQQ